MWDVKHNHSEMQMVDMTDSPAIDIGDIIPELRDGIKWLNKNDEKVYEYTEGKWIYVE